MVKQVPEGFAGLGGIRLRPCSHAGRLSEEERLDLISGRRRVLGVVEADVNGAEPGLAQPREDTGLEEGRFPESRLAEEDDERAQPGELREVIDFVVTAVKIRALILREGGEARPRIVTVDRGDRSGTLNTQR